VVQVRWQVLVQISLLSVAYSHWARAVPFLTERGSMEGKQQTIGTEIRVHIACGNEALRELIRYTAESLEWTLAATDENAVVVTDHHVDRSGRNVVVVVDPGKPAHALLALRRISAGSIGGALTADRLLYDLPLIVGAASTGVVAFSGVLSAHARQCPTLTARQERVLHMIAFGLSYTLIAQRLRVSLATIKREVSSLFELFGCGTQTVLVAVAIEAGFLKS
jgi:DNA-binding NarL/FixJ family response regulator